MMNTTSPAFFKVFIAEISDQNLKIPPAFTQSLEEALPCKVYLKDRHNNVWSVKVGKIGNCWHFLDGWVTFSRDNFLSSGDILVFEYFSDSWFSVLMYGTSATEKNIVSFMPMGHVSEHITYDTDDDNRTEGFKYAIKGSDNETGVDEYDNDNDDDQEFALEQANATGGAGTNINTIQLSLRRDCYGVEIFQAGLAQQPINPYFVTKVMQKRKGDLFVPKDIIKDFNIDFTEEITLVDPASREFRGKCKIWNDGRVVISGGWRSLCRLNLVAQDDKCICEFVQDVKGRRLFLKVSFVRANEN
ncbi:putative B3 domain-containing protein at5g66980 [Phtheirospermum japonicum]|uniref:Putative B3 domain-containing protein at5g66980 n=1 Tax=Phtheirospermum japonicum TaxID=374723 RepID=A0A830B4P7_9LAMI|nr:putative B3 domain-containing protein at5g66980 [Phtheirospermum japonicum]